jgi:putative transposase
LTKAVLGYALAYGQEYNKDDFAEAIQAAISKHRPVALTMPGLKVRDGGGYPTQVQPELAFHRWQFLQYDEAKCHLAESSLLRLNETLGTVTIAGRLGEPNDRS